MRQRDVPEAVPGIRTVDPRCPQQLLGHGLEPGQEHNHSERILFSDVGNDQ
jgi:hypothetical protein